MPLTAKGKKILAAMKVFYKRKEGSITGAKKAKQVFYASIADGKITGAEGKSKAKKKKKSKKK